MTETCAPCNATEQLMVNPTDNLPLCRPHWNAFLIRYLHDEPPCGAHLIGEKQ